MANGIRNGILRLIGLSTKQPIRPMSMNVWKSVIPITDIPLYPTFKNTYEYVIPPVKPFQPGAKIDLPSLESLYEVKCKKKSRQKKRNCFERKSMRYAKDCPIKIKKGYHKPAREDHPCQPYGGYNDDPCDPWAGTRRSCEYERRIRCFKRQRARRMLGKPPCKCPGDDVKKCRK